MDKKTNRFQTMYRSCPLCECRDDQLLIMPFEKMVPLYKEKLSMPIVRCGSCGMVYADLPESVAMACNENYDNEQLRDYIKSATKIQYWAYQSQIDRLGPPKPGQRLLDYGAGIGSLMLIAHELGWDAYGVDPSPYASWAIKHLGLNVFVGYLDTSPYPDGFFDAIVTLSTLEHIYHPKHELAVIYRKLRPGGVCLVGGIPNFDSLENAIVKGFSNNWGPILHDNAPPSHINFLTTHTIEKMVERSGFSKIKVDTYGLKRLSQMEVDKCRKKILSEGNSNFQKMLSHPFLNEFASLKNSGFRDVVLKWVIKAYMDFRFPLWGDKLLVIAEK